MRKIFSIFLCLLLCVLLTACGGNDAKKEYYQEMTIVTMPSPPKCKTTRDIGTIDKVLSLFAAIPKSPLGENVNGWQYLIKLDVDGQVFSFSVSESVYTDSDGSQYSIDGEALLAELSAIYIEIDAKESDY